MYGIGLHKIEEPAKPYGQSTAQLLQILVQVMTERLSGETRSNLAAAHFLMCLSGMSSPESLTIPRR